ncbi:MAG TPA: hypothetical protein VK636_19465 [Gemmatimonadaceae bacterium]|nr:hypothetical protein [Gemmatimonadaceae bacterium]
MPKPGGNTKKGSRKVQRNKVKTDKNGINKSKVKHVATVVVPRVSARALARAATGADKPSPRYFTDPLYGDWDAGTGATSMEVLIGPAQADLGNYGGTPDANTPTIMRMLLDSPEYNYFGWIAGHLLNDNLGGPGWARNLTPLTTAGNKNHLNGCETFIKNYIDMCDRRVWANKAELYWYGVKYKVVVGDEKWGDPGDGLLEFVATELRVWVEAVRMKKSDDVISSTPANDPSGMYFAPLVNFQIDNTGYDLI